MNYSNPWKRLGAYIIDSFILSAAMQVLFSAAMPIYASLNSELLKKFLEAAEQSKNGPSAEMITQVLYSFVPFVTVGVILTLIAWWLYFALMESSAHRATLGKKVFGMIVVDERGQRIDFKTASLRIAVKYLCGLFFLLYLPIFFTQKKQTIHDFAANTVVINK